MKTKLFKYQEDAVEFHLRHHYSLNLCEMGLGKTLMALATAERVGGKTLIVCPTFLRFNWHSEIRKHVDSLDYNVLTYSALSKGNFPADKKYDTIIFDEIHYLKNAKAYRTRTATRMIQKLSPTYLIGLTGTPIKNRIPEYYTLLSMVSFNPKKTSGVDFNKFFANQYQFSERYCYSEPNKFSGGKDYYGFRMDRLSEFRHLLKDKVFKVDGSKVLDLPPISHVTYEANYDLPDHIVDGLAEEMLEFSGGVTSKNKRMAASLKVKSTVNYVDNILEQGNQVVVFTDHISAAKSLACGFSVPPITGETPMKERESIYNKFIEGKTKVLVATIGSFSVGVNLTNASNLVFNDVSWVPGDNVQALKRIHRIGQGKHCNIHYIVCGEIDGQINGTIRSKMEVIMKTNSLALEVSK